MAGRGRPPRRVVEVDDLVPRFASQEGNALAVCSRLGLAGDPHVASRAESLAEWQGPEGGWNCDKRPLAHHSSFREPCPPVEPVGVPPSHRG